MIWMMTDQINIWTKPEEKTEIKHQLLVSIFSFLSLAIPGCLVQGKVDCLFPRVLKIPEEKSSDLPEVSARAKCED